MSRPTGTVTTRVVLGVLVVLLLVVGLSMLAGISDPTVSAPLPRYGGLTDGR